MANPNPPKDKDKTKEDKAPDTPKVQDAVLPGATPDAGSGTAPDPMATTGGGDPKDGVTLVDQPTAHDDDAQGTTVTPGEIDQESQPYPKPQSADGAFVNDEGIDLNAEADHGPDVQGNKYGSFVGQDAAANYRDEAEAKIQDLERQIEATIGERDRWAAIANGENPDAEADSESDSVKNKNKG